MANLDRLRVNATDGVVDFYTFGDWCAVGARSDVTPTTGPPLSAFNWLLSVDAMAVLSTVVGNTSGAAYYTELGAKMRPLYHKRFYNNVTGRLASGLIAYSLLLLACYLLACYLLAYWPACLLACLLTCLSACLYIGFADLTPLRRGV